MKTHHFSASVVAISLLASSVVTAQPDSVVNVVPASRNRDPGSIAALLDHISAQGRKALPINMIPDELKSKPTPADNATPVIRNPKNVNLEGALSEFSAVEPAQAVADASQTSKRAMSSHPPRNVELSSKG